MEASLMRGKMSRTLQAARGTQRRFGREKVKIITFKLSVEIFMFTVEKNWTLRRITLPAENFGRLILGLYRIADNFRKKDNVRDRIRQRSHYAGEISKRS